MGALAVPAAGALPQARVRGRTVLLHDPELPIPATLTGALEMRPIAGDPVRFARAVFVRAPAMVLGISRHADALLIEDVGREAGYRPVTAPASLGRHGWALAPRS